MSEFLNLDKKYAGILLNNKRYELKSGTCSRGSCEKCEVRETCYEKINDIAANSLIYFCCKAQNYGYFKEVTE